MPNRTVPNGTPEAGAKAVKRALAAAKAAKNWKLSSRQRVPAQKSDTGKTSDSWDAKVGKAAKEAFLLMIETTRPGGAITEADVLLANSVYFAACGLSLGYAHLGAAGWIDENKHAFHPIVEVCLKLQREILDAYRAAGVDKPAKLVEGSVIDQFREERRLAQAKRNGHVLQLPAALPVASGVPTAVDGFLASVADATQLATDNATGEPEGQEASVQ